MVEINQERDSSIEAERPSLEISDQVCNNTEIHPLKKDVQMLLINGSLICPICEREKQNKELQAEMEQRVKTVEKNRNLKALSELSMITDKTLLEASFQNYETEQGSEAASNKDKMVRVYKYYRQGDTFNTWLYGNPGAGKSHLAMALLNSLSVRGEGEYTCLFIKVDKLMSAVRNTYSKKYQGNDTEDSIIRTISKADYVVLDDLGAEVGAITSETRASDFVHRILYGITDGRQGKSTIITTNLDNKQIREVYDEKLYSRLMYQAKVVAFTQTKDYRMNGVSNDW